MDTRNRLSIFNCRRDMLAYGSLRGRKWGSPGWTVVFQYRRLGQPEHGRAVTMDPLGHEVKIEHPDFILRELHGK
jgi:hypothetical protein